ncbi:GNAT family N-acetyltransferase [Bacillus clarus]|nr:GNAT family N-acetyltransferase [Bacillus clarus]KFM95032.1 acetyltransferase domain protein [Bacillus clarus]
MIIKEIDKYDKNKEVMLLRESFISKWKKILGTNDNHKIDMYLESYNLTTEKRFSVIDGDNGIVGVFGVNALNFSEKNFNSKNKDRDFPFWEKLRWQLGMWLLYTKPQKDVLYLSFFAINKKFRGKGYGRKILDEVIKIAKCENKSTVKLYVSQTNEIAIHLYQRYGFKIHKTERYLLTKWFLGEENWLVMKKKVEESDDKNN